MDRSDMSEAKGSAEAEKQGQSSGLEPPLDQARASNRRRDSDASSDVSSTIMKAKPSLLYRPFPQSMKICYQWSLTGFNVLYVCGGNQHDRIFAVKVHQPPGFLAPLGIFPGLSLYNGPSTKDPLIAAFGHKSSLPFFRAISFMLSSTTNYLALLPSGESNKPDEWESETVHAHTTPKPDHNVSFSFSVEIGREKNKRREAFEWRAVKKSERDDGMQNGGFKLLWLSPNAEQSDLGEGSSSQSTTNNSEGNGVVAILSWYSSLASPKHPFDLTIMGGDEFNRLGERCLLMVLVTALGLWWLHGQGKTSHRAIAVAEKITGKGKSVA